METPNLIEDFWTCCSNYEITRNNAIWSCMGALAGAVNRKVYTKIGDIPIYCNLFILLVGSPGTGKSTSMSFAKRMFTKACPEIELGPSKQSHGDIIKYMSTEACALFYTDHHGVRQETRVYNFFIDEFKNFVAYDIIGMLNFLTGIYSADEEFNASTLSRGKENIPFPSLSFLACENPSWMIRNIKNDSISDGLGRRVIIVHELEDASPKPEVIITPEIRIVVERLVAKMKIIKNLTGEYTFTPEGRVFYNEWYLRKHAHMLTITDQVFRGYIRSKHIMLLKVAMLVDCSTTRPSYKFTRDLLELALAMLDSIEPNIPKLFVSAGRNELAAPQQRLIELIQSQNGRMLERDILRLTAKDLSPQEQVSLLLHLKNTQELYRVQEKDAAGTLRWWYLTADAYQQELKRGGIKSSLPSTV